MKVVLLALGFGVAVWAAGAASGARQPAPEGVLVAPRPSHSGLVGPHESSAGLLLVTPSGEVRRVLGPTWSPVAPAGRDGPFVVQRRGPLGDSRPLVVVDRGRSTEVPGSAGARCVAWSADRQRVAYLTGKVGTLPEPASRMPAWTIEGALWIVDRRSPSRPSTIRTGVFALGECPAWSRSGMLAYVVGSSPGWSLTLWRSGEATAVAELAAPSAAYRTFAWAPGSDRLVFLDRDALFELRAGTPVRLTQERALADVGAAAGADRFLHSVRFSPNGRLVAVSIGRETAIVTTSGRLLRIVPGTFNGWAGNTGVLALRAEERGVTLRLHPLSRPSSSRALAWGFKYGTVTHPAGIWFAHPAVSLGSGGRALARWIHFRRPDGSLLRRVRLDGDAFPWPVAGVAKDGRVVEPASAY